MGKLADQWDALLTRMGLAQGVDPKFLKTILIKESGGNPGAINHNANGTVDYGLMQINSGDRDPNGNPYNVSRLMSDPAYNVQAAIDTIKEKQQMVKADGRDPNNPFNIFWYYNGRSAQGQQYAQSALSIYQQMGGVASVPGGTGPPAPGEQAPGWNATAPSSGAGGQDLSFSQSIARLSLLTLLGLVGVFALFQMIGGGKVVEMAAHTASKGVI